MTTAKRLESNNGPDIKCLIDEAGLPRWKSLYRIMGVATIVMLILIPVQIAVYTIWPMPESIAEWFQFFRNNWLLGLLHLDVLYIINNTIVALMYLALYTSLRQKSEAWMIIALLTGMLGIAAYYSSNPAFEMLSLSHLYEACSTETERTLLLASGQTLISQWKGTAFDIYYILSAISLIITAVVMFKSSIYTKTTATIGLLSGLLMLIPSSAGTFGVFFSLASLVPWVIFSFIIAVKFFKLSKLECPENNYK